MPTSTIIHVVPLQIEYSGDQAIIRCIDGRARINDAGELVFELKQPAVGEPTVNQMIRFTATDPPDLNGYDDHLNMYSAPPLERLKVWVKADETSTSPNLMPGCDYELVVVAFGEPSAVTPSAAVRIRHGRRRLKVRYEGAGDLL